MTDCFISTLSILIVKITILKVFFAAIIGIGTGPAVYRKETLCQAQNNTYFFFLFLIYRSSLGDSQFYRALFEYVAKANAYNLLRLGHDPVACMRGSGARRSICVICEHTPLYEYCHNKHYKVLMSLLK